MIVDVACVEDCGDKLHVKYVDNQKNALFKNDGIYVKISKVAADDIRKSLREGNIVYLPKNVSGELTFSDVVVVETDDLMKDKLLFLSDVYRLVDYALFYVSATDFFEYLSVYNDLHSLGICITNDNREEKYLEIIETGDEKLIEKLETYLEKKDKLESISYVYKRSREFEKKAFDCETIEELELVKEEYYKK